MRVEQPVASQWAHTHTPYPGGNLCKTLSLIIPFGDSPGSVLTYTSYRYPSPLSPVERFSKPLLWINLSEAFVNIFHFNDNTNFLFYWCSWCSIPFQNRLVKYRIWNSLKDLCTTSINLSHFSAILFNHLSAFFFLISY